VVFV
jgi:hypothetical protein